MEGRDEVSWLVYEVRPGVLGYRMVRDRDRAFSVFSRMGKATPALAPTMWRIGLRKVERRADGTVSVSGDLVSRGFLHAPESRIRSLVLGRRG